MRTKDIRNQEKVSIRKSQTIKKPIDKVSEDIKERTIGPSD